jgi:hypothetical protein
MRGGLLLAHEPPRIMRNPSDLNLRSGQPQPFEHLRMTQFAVGRDEDFPGGANVQRNKALSSASRIDLEPRGEKARVLYELSKQECVLPRAARNQHNRDSASAATAPNVPPSHRSRRLDDDPMTLGIFRLVACVREFVNRRA